MGPLSFAVELVYVPVGSEVVMISSRTRSGRCGLEHESRAASSVLNAVCSSLIALAHWASLVSVGSCTVGAGGPAAPISWRAHVGGVP